MRGIRREADDAGRWLRPPATATADEHDDAQDPTTLKFDGPVRISDDDAGSDPYNRTGQFKRFVR